MELHPLCTLFPRLSAQEHDALVTDIKVHGLREPITLHDGMILDGGNRYRACVDAGIEPATRPYEGGSIVAFVLSANLHRRHMTPGQQAAIVASAADWAKAHRHGGDRRSDQAATLPLETVADRARTAGAADRTQRMADKVVRADPEAAKAVGRGEVSLPAALRKVEGKPDRDDGPTAAEMLDEMHADVRAAEARADQAESIARELEDAMKGDDGKAKLSTLIRRLEHAERRTAELMEDSAKSKASSDWHMRQLARCGKAVGERDLDKIAPAVEAMARRVKAC